MRRLENAAAIWKGMRTEADYGNRPCFFIFVLYDAGIIEKFSCIIKLSTNVALVLLFYQGIKNLKQKYLLFYKKCSVLSLFF